MMFNASLPTCLDPTTLKPPKLVVATILDASADYITTWPGVGYFANKTIRKRIYVESVLFLGRGLN